MWLVKLDNAGVAIHWDRTYGGSLDDQNRSLQITSDGGFILGGPSNSPANGTKTTAAYSLSHDFYFVKTDSNGTIEWDAVVGGTNEEDLYRVKESPKGNFVAVGYSQSGIGGNKTTGNSGGQDFWMTMIDKDGNFLYDRNLGGGLGEYASDFLFTADPGYLIGGQTFSGISGDKTAGNYDPTHNTRDCWVVKLDCNFSVNLPNDTAICYNDPFLLDAYNNSYLGCQFLWQDSNADSIRTVNPTADITYTVTVTDVNGCTAIDDISLTVNPLPIVDLGNDTLICQGDSIILDAENTGTNYIWSTLENTQTIAVRSTNIYSVTVTDANQCQNNDALSLVIAPLPTPDLGSNQSICPGSSIPLNTGISGATYLWSTGATSPGISVDTAGRFYVTVTDAISCEGIDSIDISFFPIPTVDLGNDTSLCQGQTLILDAGNPGATYNWSNGPASQTITVSTASTYIVTVTNPSGCFVMDTIVVSVNPLPIINLDPNTNICQGDSLSLDAENPGATYLWSTTESSQTITVNSANTYSVTVTDVNSCSATDDIDISLSPLPSAHLGNDTSICQGAFVILNAENTRSHVQLVYWSNFANPHRFYSWNLFCNRYWCNRLFCY